MNADLTVLKIGGSVITYKKQPFTANTSAIERIAEEISKARASRLILVHGGGSFGHPFAKKYAIKEGYNGDQRQLVGFSKTHQSMIALNKLVMEALIRHNIPAVAVSPSSCTVTKSGRIATFIDEPLTRLFTTGFVPVLYGDAVPDSDRDFTILSGDQIAAFLATRFNAKKMAMGVDVDGLFTDDPTRVKTASLIARCTPEDLRKMQAQTKAKQKTTDVTGGMLGKIIELTAAVERGVPALIFNATQPQNVYKVLRGKEVVGTLIKKT